MKYTGGMEYILVIFYWYDLKFHWFKAEHDIRLTLQWRHTGPHGVSNHQPHHCLINRFIQAQIKENITALRHWPLWGEYSGEFPAQMASNAENVSIWWRHHDLVCKTESGSTVDRGPAFIKPMLLLIRQNILLKSECVITFFMFYTFHEYHDNTDI